MRKKRALPDGLVNASYRTLRCHSGSLRYGRRAPGAVIPFSRLSTQRYLVIIIPFRQQRREERSGKRSRRGILPSRPIVGAFVFPDFWENSLRAKSNLARLRDCGVNAIMTESDSYELSALDATHKAGLRFFAGIACFSDHASNFCSLNKRPELWPVLENGERRPQMEWYVGMSPTDRTRQEEALAEIKSISLNYPVDGVFLDFARWPLHWEIELRPGRGRPLDSTFDPATLAKFEEATGALPRGLDSTSARAAWIREKRTRRVARIQMQDRERFRRRGAECTQRNEGRCGARTLRRSGCEWLDGVLDRPAHQRSHTVGRLGRAHALPQHFASASDMDRIGALVCGQGRREKDTAGPAGRIRTATPRSLATGDRRCRPLIGAKHFRKSPGDPRSTGSSFSREWRWWVKGEIRCERCSDPRGDDRPCK